MTNLSLALLLLFMVTILLLFFVFRWYQSSKAHQSANGLLSAQYRALNSLIQYKALEDKLDDICLLIESQVKGALCSIMLADKAHETLSPVSSIQLPQGLLKALQGLPIGDGIGACGTAAATGKAVIIPDMLKDERCAEFHDLINEYKLRGCWSHPIFISENDQPIGTFALYFKNPRPPKKQELELIHRSRELASLIIEQNLHRVRRERVEQHNRSLFTHNPEAVFTLDLNGNFESVNRAGCEMIQYSEEELIGQHYSLAVAKDDLARTNEHFDAARKGIPQRYEIKALDRHGNTLHLHVTNMPIIVDDKITGVHGIALNRTKEKKHEAQLKILERSVESSRHGLIICDAQQQDMPVIYTNPAFEEITGYSEAETLGKNCRFLQGAETDQGARQAIREALDSQQEISTVIKNYKKDGTPFWNELLISPVKDNNGAVSHFIGLQNDITERIQRQDNLEFQMSHDELTHLKNRTSLERHLQQLVQQPDTGTVYVLFIDLDGFKPINDSLGHEVGDQILVETAQRLNDLILEPNLLARFGGDEYVAIVQNTPDKEQVKSLARQLLQAISKTYTIDGLEISLSAAIGIACSDDEFIHPMELIQRADIAMYEAKKRGGSYVYWHSSELDTPVEQQVTLRAQLQDAIQQQQFELFYQPIMDQHQQVVSVEALIRWKHPLKGYISPADFIPVAERTGQIIALSEWVFEQACRDSKRLQKIGINSVSVNFSPIQFYREDFIEKIRQTLIKHQIKPGQITIEITENVLVHDTAHISDLLQQLQELGLDIALDDFGSGFASLRYLNLLPVDKLKIDRSFTSKIHQNAHNAAITRAILGMTAELGIRVIAEGVETEEEYQYLKRHHCDLMQGFLFCRPIPLAELLEWAHQLKPLPQV